MISCARAYAKFENPAVYEATDPGIRTGCLLFDNSIALR